MSRHVRPVLLMCALIIGAALISSVGGTASGATGTPPSIAKDNDANHDGIYSDTESVPKSVTYPWTVTYRLTIDAGTSVGIRCSRSPTP